MNLSRSSGGASETYTYVGDQIARIDRGGGIIIDSAIDAMGSRLTVGGAWLVPNVRGDVAALLDAGQTAVSDAYRFDPYGQLLASLGHHQPVSLRGPAAGSHQWRVRLRGPPVRPSRVSCHAPIR